jgi:hypothetical protein
LKALTEELQTTTDIAAKTHKGQTLIKKMGKAIKHILNPPASDEQRMDKHEVLRMNQEGLVISQGGWIGFVVG